MLGILNNSLGNAFASWVMIGVTDLDRGVLGVLNDCPANGVAYWMLDEVTDLDRDMSWILNNSPGKFAYWVIDGLQIRIGVC